MATCLRDSNRNDGAFNVVGASVMIVKPGGRSPKDFSFPFYSPTALIQFSEHSRFLSLAFQIVKCQNQGVEIWLQLPLVVKKCYLNADLHLFG